MFRCVFGDCFDVSRCFVGNLVGGNCMSFGLDLGKNCFWVSKLGSRLATCVVRAR